MESERESKYSDKPEVVAAKFDKAMNKPLLINICYNAGPFAELLFILHLFFNSRIDSKSVSDAVTFLRYFYFEWIALTVEFHYDH